MSVCELYHMTVRKLLLRHVPILALAQGGMAGGVGPGVAGTVRGAVSGGLSGVPPRVAQPTVRRPCTGCNPRAVRGRQK